MTLVDNSKYPHLANLVTEVLNVWPEHQRYLENSLRPRQESFLSFSEKLSDMVIRLATADGGLRMHVDDYQFLCEEIYLPEELHFRRTGSRGPQKFQEGHTQP